MDLTQAIIVDQAARERDPKPGEKTALQTEHWPNAAFPYSSYTAACLMSDPEDVCRTVCGTIRWSNIYTRSYWTYRLMRNMPTIAIARSIVMAPIIASQWTMEYPDETPQEWIKFAEEKLLPLRKSCMSDVLRALDYGHSLFEIIWEVEDGRMFPKRLKPLAVDRNDILVDKNGNFAGVRPDMSPRGAASNDLGPEKSWCYTNDGEFGDLIGRSRFENLRETAWADWWDTAHKSRKLREKLSGIIPIIYHPPGGATDSDGNKYTYQSQALIALKNLSMGYGITLENLGFNTQDPKLLERLTKTSLTNVDFYDAGDFSPAQNGMILQLEYDDRQMMRGYLRPERVAMEGQHGTKAESAIQGEVAIYDAEVIDDDIALSFSENIVDRAMVLNFGEKARGVIRMKPAPLVDRKIAAYREVMSAFLKIPELAVALAKTIDLEQILDFFDIKTDKDFEATIEKLELMPPPAPAPAGAKPNGKPKASEFDRAFMLNLKHEIADAR